MSQERTRGRMGGDEAFDTSLMYDDIERIREREEAQEKTENDKLSFAGMMALVAGVGLIVLGVFGTGIPGGVIEFLQPALQIVGVGALGYGFYKTLKLAFRKNELNFPALNVYRKSKPRARAAAREPREQSQTAETTSSTRSSTGSETNYRTRTYRRRSSTRTTSGQKKSLRRSRTNRVFSGVAGGIAEYTGVSAALVRFAFIAGLFMTGFMFVFVYLLLSIVLPADFDDFPDVDDKREIRVR